MNERGMAAIAAAGLDVGALLSTPGAQLAAVRDQLLGQGDSLPQGAAPSTGGDHSAARRAGRLLTVRAERARVIGGRQAFVRVLLALVERAAAAEGAAPAAADGAAGASGGSPASYGLIEFAWGASLESLDLAGRTATFAQQQGDAQRRRGTQQRYDLLVAADGFASRCRRAAQAQAGGALAVRVVPPNRQYKVRAVPGWPTGSGRGSVLLLTGAGSRSVLSYC